MLRGDRQVAAEHPRERLNVGVGHQLEVVVPPQRDSQLGQAWVARAGRAVPDDGARPPIVACEVPCHEIARRDEVVVEEEQELDRAPHARRGCGRPRRPARLHGGGDRSPRRRCRRRRGTSCRRPRSPRRPRLRAAPPAPPGSARAPAGARRSAPRLTPPALPAASVPVRAPACHGPGVPHPVVRAARRRARGGRLARRPGPRSRLGGSPRRRARGARRPCPPTGAARPSDIGATTTSSWPAPRARRPRSAAWS